MSWTELERLVTEAETDENLRTILRSCESQTQLLLVARRQGYHITRVDLQKAWQDHRDSLKAKASGC
jgi:predicted ribosomally synthesized peptide with nif11-like leader